MSKRSTSKAFVWALRAVPALAIVCLALLISIPAWHRSAGMPLVSSASRGKTLSPDAKGRIQANYAALPIAFEQNQGQTDGAVKYMARTKGYTLFLTNHEAVFSLHSSSASSQSSVTRRGMVGGKSLSSSSSSSLQRGAEKETSAVVHMQLLGANAPTEIAANDQLPGHANYFLGNDPGKWRSNVPLYARVSYQNVYPGVSLAFHGQQKQLEFDFLVAAGANPQPIGFQLTGAKGIKTDDSGNLIVSSTAGEVVLHKPVAYQQENSTRHSVNARFVLKADNRVSFELGFYDHSRELVIDPTVAVAYASYLGGSLEDGGYGIAVDNSGNAYVTGQTASDNFPTVAGGYLGSNAGGNSGTSDVFVTKVAAGGASLVYSTYVGGTANDSGNAIAIDANGDAFVAGGTASTDFPFTSAAFQKGLRSSSASSNGFVFELNSSGSALTYSTYLGGSVDDVAFGIAVDASGNSYIVGSASSPDFPTLNPLQTYPSTAPNGFVTKLNPTGGALVYSTYLNLGGTTGDSANAVALDSSNNAYVTGAASSASFHTTTGAFQTKCGTDGTCNGGLSDAFVTVINTGGSGYIYSTFLGGSSPDAGNGIAVDSSGNAYVTGSTESSDFPVKSPAIQGTYGQNTDAFVTKLNSTGSALVYSTYLGGGQFDSAGGIAVDSGGNAYVTGQTSSLAPSPFPTTLNATQATNAGGDDAFVSEINAAGSKLLFSTYLGGPGNEDINSDYGAIAVDRFGSGIYVTGNTSSTVTSFPVVAPYTSPAPGGGTYGGGTSDAFVAEYTQPSFSMSATTPAAVAPGGSATSTVTLTALNGYNSPVNLTCTVTGTGSPLPTCSATSFSVNPVTPTVGGAATTLTVATTGSSGALIRERKIYYALWLSIAGLGLVGFVFCSSNSRRKTLFGLLMIGIAALLMLPACGGSSNNGGSGSCAAAPSAPTGLAASATTSTGTTLNWSAAAVGAHCSVSGYTVYENGKSIGTPTTTTFNVTGLTAATQYSFTVAASDAAGMSAQSTAVSVTTLSNATPAGNYTITITGTGTDSNATTQSVSIPLTVN